MVTVMTDHTSYNLPFFFEIPPFLMGLVDKFTSSKCKFNGCPLQRALQLCLISILINGHHLCSTYKWWTQDPYFHRVHLIPHKHSVLQWPLFFFSPPLFFLIVAQQRRGLQQVTVTLPRSVSNAGLVWVHQQWLFLSFSYVSTSTKICIKHISQNEESNIFSPNMLQTERN